MKTVKPYNPATWQPWFLAVIGASAIQCAYADGPTQPGDFTVSNTEWPIIHVTGADGVYTQTTSVAHVWQADIFIDASGNSKIKSWSVWPSVENTQDHVVAGKPTGPDLSSWDIGESLPVGKRPKQISKTVGNTISTGLQSWSVAQCNNLVQFLGDAGMDAAEIHGVERPLAVEWRLKSDISFYDPTPLLFDEFGASDAWSPPEQSVVVCEAITPPTPNTGGSGEVVVDLPDFELLDTELHVFHTASGQCPRDILVSSTTRSNVPGDFDLWYEIASDQAGNLKSVNYALSTAPAGDAGLMEAGHMDTFSVPLAGLENTGGGHTAGFGADTAGFLPGVGAGGEGDGPSWTPTAGADFGNEAPNAGNVHTGKVRVVAQRQSGPENPGLGGIVIASQPAADTVVSEWKDYHIVCDIELAPVSSGLATDLTDGAKDPQQAFQPAFKTGVMTPPTTGPGSQPGNELTGVSVQDDRSVEARRRHDAMVAEQRAAREQQLAAIRARMDRAREEQRREATLAAQQAAQQAAEKQRQAIERKIVEQVAEERRKLAAVAEERRARITAKAKAEQLKAKRRNASGRSKLNTGNHQLILMRRGD